MVTYTSANIRPPNFASSEPAVPKGVVVISQAQGELEPTLLEETIGANLERTVAANPDREALVEMATGRRWTYPELNHDDSPLRQLSPSELM